MTDWLARLRKLDSVQYASADIAKIAENDAPANFDNIGNYGTGPIREEEADRDSSAAPAHGHIPGEGATADIAEIAENDVPANFGNSGNYGTGTFAEIANPDPDDLEERAAIIAEGSGCPLEWAEGLARLDPNRPPKDVPPAHWIAFCDTAGTFVDQWAARADALGWTTQQVFGCDRYAPFARLDRQGLIWSLVGCTLVDLTATEATIETVTGSRLKFPKRPVDREPARAAMAWDDI